MANETAIGWTDLSWNPVHGCSVVSPGCAHCYAATDSLRRGHTKKPWTPENAAENVLRKPHKLKEPKSGAKVWRGLGEAAARAGKTDGKLVFVNSMSDLFHEQVPDAFIAQVFAVMAATPKHTFQVLTKRPDRMRRTLTTALFWDEVRHHLALNPAALECVKYEAVPNVWLGVSIENRKFVSRADVLRETPAAVRFISAEPLLGPLVKCGRCQGRGGMVTWCDLDPSQKEQIWCERCRLGEGYPNREGGLDLTDIDWLIVGGESGPGHRPMREEWVRDLRDACEAQGYIANGEHYEFARDDARPACAFFFKQWGGAKSTSGGRDLDGRTWDEFPQVREAVVA